MMHYSEWVVRYQEALDCEDWFTCDQLAENYPEHSDMYFADVDGDVGDDDDA